ncbi:MAG TPA: 30S ribosome-binding factor RbfA [Clostridiales bacterium]|nr:30S ribosome-binding factor RbfA [Clostridiales bacterium]
MSRGYRPQRLGEEIRKIISDMLVRGDLKDPGFQGLIGVNAVEVTRDGSYATVYVTALGNGAADPLTEEEKNDILAAFQRSRGFLRTELARLIQIRHTPVLLFRFDTSVEYGMKMDKILSDLDIPEDEPEV